MTSGDKIDLLLKKIAEARKEHGFSHKLVETKGLRDELVYTVLSRGIVPIPDDQTPSEAYWFLHEFGEMVAHAVLGSSSIAPCGLGLRLEKKRRQVRLSLDKFCRHVVSTAALNVRSQTLNEMKACFAYILKTLQAEWDCIEKTYGGQSAKKS